jgi:molybdopterin converting factor subunit 1
MRIHLRLFSVAKDIAGFDEQICELGPDADTSVLLRHLVEAHPALADWKGTLRMAVNYEYVGPAQKLKDGDEVAIIPPVSGG